MHKIPYNRSEAIMFKWDKDLHQWKSSTMKLKKNSSMKRAALKREVCSFESGYEIISGEFLEPAWMFAQIDKVMIEQQKINNRMQLQKIFSLLLIGTLSISIGLLLLCI